MEVEAKSHARTPPAARASPAHTARPGPVAPIAAAGPTVIAAPPPQLPGQLLDWVDAHRRLLFGGLVVLYVLGFNGQWRLDPDSALYLTIGRNLAEGRGYTYHGEPHHLAYPGMPLLYAGLFKVFGSKTLLPAHGVMLLFALATLALTYRLFHLHAGRPTAVLMTLVLGLSRTFYRHSFELLSDLPFLMGVMAFLVGYEAVSYRRYDPDVRESLPGERAGPAWFDAVLLLAGLGVAMVMRPTMWALLAAVVAAVVLSLFTRPLRKGWVIVGGGFVVAAVTAGVLFYSLDPRRGGRTDPGDYERVLLDALRTHPAEVFGRMIHQNLPDLFHPGAAEAVFGIDFGHFDPARTIPVNPIPSALSLAAGLFLFRRRLLWGMWVLVTVLMMLVTLVHVRYFLQVLPLLLYGWWASLAWLDGKLAGRKWLGRLPMLVFAALVAVNVVRVAGLVVEQRRTPFLAHYRDGKYALVPQLTELLKAQTPQKGWVLVPERQLGRILTYLSGRYAVEPNPTVKLNARWQPVYVLEPMDGDAAAALAARGIAVGEAVGPAVTGRRGKTWQLHRAVPAPARAVEAPPP